ncbi:MAG: GNAT family N-acetyltransferase [Clostridiales bacterium]|nr:GNAT family N-acetyltransferase [Clostridiales bacterium]
MRINFETEHLIIRPLVPEDAEAAFRWCGDPNVNTYMIYPLYTRVEDVRAWLESRDPDDPDNYDEGIVLKSTGELIGSGGMCWHPERNAWEIGYNLRADQWGHGYTGEYLTALMERIRKVRPVEAIDGVFAAENHKSRRVMEKLGMVWVRDTQYDKLDGSRTYPAKYFRRNLSQPADLCLICGRIEKIMQGTNPYFVKELETGYVVLGDHQYFEGYTLLLCKEHATELSQLTPDFRSAFLRDMAVTAEAVENAFRPDKLNYELLGTGTGRHMHWHIFPRRSGDTPAPGPVWQVREMNDDRYLPSAEKLEELKASLKKELDRLVP